MCALEKGGGRGVSVGRCIGIFQILLTLNSDNDGRKTVCTKKKRKTSFEMDGQCCSRPEGNEDKAVDGDDAR